MMTKKIPEEFLNTIKQAIDLLPAYDDVSWIVQPDNVKCDVAYAKQLLFEAVLSEEK